MSFISAPFFSQNKIIDNPVFDYFLDTYSGAAAGYSLRKLSSSYTGNCITVRRSSDSAEQNIGFVNNVLDTTALLSFVGADTGFVKTWFDQSGNGNNLTQTNTLLQPYIVNTGVLQEYNNKPVIFFPPVNRLISNSAVFSSGSTNYSFFIIGLGNYTGDNTIGFFHQGNLSTNRSVGLGGGNPAPIFIRHFWWGNDQDTLTNASFLNNRLLMSGFWENPTRVIDVVAQGGANENSTATTSGKNTVNNSLELGKVFRNNAQNGSLNGFIQEFIAYNSSLYSNMSIIKTSINNYYSIY
jgi:hypothetical protein